MLCYQIRQLFKAREVTPEEANQVGYKAEMRRTKGKYAFFVTTHTGCQLIHIISRPFRIPNETSHGYESDIIDRNSINHGRGCSLAAQLC